MVVSHQKGSLFLWLSISLKLKPFPWIMITRGGTHKSPAMLHCRLSLIFVRDSGAGDARGKTIYIVFLLYYIPDNNKQLLAVDCCVV